MSINNDGEIKIIRVYYYIAVAPHIRFWTIFPWIRTWHCGAEFTWLFLVVARYWEVVASEEVQ